MALRVAEVPVAGTHIVRRTQLAEPPEIGTNALGQALQNVHRQRA